MQPPRRIDSKLGPLCQMSRLMRPLPSPPGEFDRLIGSEKVLPPSRELAKKISPPWEAPEKMISCQIIRTDCGAPGAM
ncbi:MAG TPA: hypothetical protein VGP12_05310 [Nitrosospira sp.]|jgi:hypothetical protein|nr:hypothetical protein [Nitrosospira sp.]